VDVDLTWCDTHLSMSHHKTPFATIVRLASGASNFHNVANCGLFLKRHVVEIVVFLPILLLKNLSVIIFKQMLLRLFFYCYYLLCRDWRSHRFVEFELFTTI